MFKSVLIHTLANTSKCAYTYRKNMNLRVSYFLLILHGMCRSSDARVGVITIDLERTLEISEYRIFHSRGGRVPEGLDFFFPSSSPRVICGCQSDHSTTNLTLLWSSTSSGRFPCFQNIGPIYRSPHRAFGRYCLHVFAASLATGSYSACKLQIPG